MKKLLLAVVVSMAVVSIPAFAHHPAESNDNMPEGTWDSIDANFLAVESPHYYMTFEDTMGSSEEMSSDGMAQNGNAQLDQVQAGARESAQSKAQEDAGDENPAAMYKHQESQNRPGLTVDEAIKPKQTETTFRAEVSTPSAKNEEGVVELYPGDRVRIAAQLMVDEDDVGQSAQCMVVAQYKNNADEDEEPTVFMLAEEGWINWNGSLSDLTGVECQLQERQTIIAHDNELFPGEFRIYFGYQLEDGKLIHSPEALRFRIE